MECRGCNNKEATRIKTTYATSGIKEVCDRCSPAKLGGYLVDVWYGYGSGEQQEENIAYPKGHPMEGSPIPFYDKRSKAEAMKIAGVREAGDRIHGMRHDQTKLNKKIQDRK